MVTIVPGLRNCAHAREQLALDFQIFGDDFDDPVRFGAARQDRLRNFQWKCDPPAPP